MDSARKPFRITGIPSRPGNKALSCQQSGKGVNVAVWAMAAGGTNLYAGGVFTTAASTVATTVNTQAQVRCYWAHAAVTVSAVSLLCSAAQRVALALDA
jgi:hypothetical protein